MKKCDLLKKCMELGITKCNSKNKSELINLINNKTQHVLIKEEIQINATETKLNVIDLFCGCGGMSKGLTDAGLNMWDKAVDNTVNNVVAECLSHFIAGTKILTNLGYKNIEDIGLEDKLSTNFSKFQNVINIKQKKYFGDLYELDIKYHPEKIICKETQQFYVREKYQFWDNLIRRYKNVFKEPKWKKVNELTQNDYYGMVINTNEIIPNFTFEKYINQNKKEQINMVLDKPEYWYMMGYFVGDGWIEETKKRKNSLRHIIKFAINNKDESEVLQKIQMVLPITDQKCNTGKCKKFGCSNYIWFQIFKMFGKYAHAKLIPNWVQDAPKEFIKEFVDGYIKADGHITKNGSLSITTVSYNLAYGIQCLYLKLGHIFGITKCIRPKTCVIEGRTVNQRDTYSIKGYLMKERNASSFIENNYVWYAPFKITKKYFENVLLYNFKVEHNNSYILENVICL